MEQKEAIFQRIGDAIKHQIIREELPLNYKLPSEFDLVEQFHVSRTTIQRALRYLENQGIIRREKGRGSFVNIQKAKIAVFNFSGFSDYVAKLGKEVVNKLITQEVIKQDNQSLLKLIRLRGMRDQEGITWLTLDQSLLRLELFPDLETYDFENVSLYETLRNDYAVFPQYSHLKSQALISSAAHKDYFELEEDTALVRIVGTVLDAEQRVLEEVSIIYSPVADFNFLVSI